MKALRKRSIFPQEGSLEIHLSPQERVHLEEALYQEVVRIQKKPWKPFAKTFSSFKELERWKARQRDPRLW